MATMSAGQAVNQQEKMKQTNIRYPFWFGGSASSMAACVTHPLDLVKVRLQTRTAQTSRSMTTTFINILRADGVRGLYKGLSASILRQLTYSTVRFGIYEDLKHRTAQDPSFAYLIAVASASGFLGGIAGNFADVINVRMQRDGALPETQRRNYKHVVDGMIRMAKEEGMLSWFRGWLPNSSRAAVQTASQLASYDVAKRILLDHTSLGDTTATQIIASFMAGLTAATVTSPIDVIKTRAMTSTGRAGILGLVREASRTDGLGWMFKGWVPSFLRLGPHTICIFFFLELHRKLYRELKLASKD